MEKKRKPFYLFHLDEGLEIAGADDKYVLIKLKVEDLPRLKLMKLPRDVRKYYKNAKRNYRKKMKSRKQNRVKKVERNG